MRKLTEYLLAAAASLIMMCGCSQRHGVVQVRLVATSGMHGLCLADDPLTGEKREGSAARLSGFLKLQRCSYDNLVYLDAGDLLRGSVESFHDRTAVFELTDINALSCNILGCEAVVPGDMDFALGGENMYSFYTGLDALVLCANMGYDNYGDFFPPYTILEKHGVRIAVMGLTFSSISDFVPDDIIRGMAFQDPVSAATHWISDIRENENPDVIVAVLHGGADDASRLAAQVPGFDLIVYSDCSGEHVGQYVSTLGDTVLTVSPGQNLTSVAVATFTVDFTVGDSPAVSVTAGVEELKNQEPDPDFEKALAARKNLLTCYLDSTIGTLGMDIDFRCASWRPTTGSALVHKYQSRQHAAQVSLAMAMNPGFYMKAGEFKGRDAFAVFPDENEMVSVMMRGSEIVSVLEYSAEQCFNTVKSANDILLKPNVSPDMIISAAGINYTIDITKPFGKRVSVLSMADGSRFNPEMEYRTTMPRSMYCRGTSQLAVIPGMDVAGLTARFNTSSKADYRFSLITDMFVSTELNTPLSAKPGGSWRLVPEKLAEMCLARDTLNIKY